MRSRACRYPTPPCTASLAPSADRRGARDPVVSRSHAAVTDPAAFADLLRALVGYAGQMVTRCALKLAPLVFARPGELRHAEWYEIDLDAAEWRIPAGKMKMGEAHVVPLSTHAVAILRDLQQRSEERRVGREGVGTCGGWGSGENLKTKKQ